MRGSEIDLKQSDEQTASFDVPESAADSKLTLKLTVTDDKDAPNTDEIIIDVEKVTDNSDNNGNS